MPDDPSNPPMDPRTRVKMGTQLWSTQVGMAEAARGDGACDQREIAYEFTNGRKFFGKRDPYSPPAE